MTLAASFINRTCRMLQKSGILKYRQYDQSPETVNNQGNLKFAKEFSLQYLPKRFAQTKAVKCWNCGMEKKALVELFCDQCNVIQNPEENGNYFRMFDLPENYDLDPKLLTKKFRSLQSVLHPDKFTTRSDEEKSISENYSSLVNKAYSVLQSPLKRAMYLLSMKGENIQEDQKIENPEFLMEIMEINEEVEEANTPDKLKQLYAKNKQELDGIAKEISECFRNNDLKRAKFNVIKMKYYWSISAHINRLLRERGIIDD